jgi:hypothetical protein
MHAGCCASAVAVAGWVPACLLLYACHHHAAAPTRWPVPPLAHLTCMEPILHALAANPQLCLPSSSQRGDGGEADNAAAAPHAALGQLREAWAADPCAFLSRHGQLLRAEDLDALDAMPGVGGNGSAASDLLAELRLRASRPADRKTSVIKNRRFRYLQHFAKTEYFSLESIQRRCPEVYAQYMAPAAGPPGEDDEVSKELDEARQMRQECSLALVGGLVGSVPAGSDGGASARPPMGGGTEMQELLEAVQGRWLRGEDGTHFNYDTVDFNDAHDDWRQDAQDAQDAYFREDSDSDDEDGGSASTMEGNPRTGVGSKRGRPAEDARGAAGRGDSSRAGGGGGGSERDALRARALAALGL